ncbi:MAG: fibronectin type III domain-containing protein [Ferruginibacter sp.]|nr:fibronectin type III domain-containing protein [Ferruginibacter sp.]
MKKLLAVLFACTVVLTIQAQKNFWSLHLAADKITTDKGVARSSFPSSFKLFDVNMAPLSHELFSVVNNTSRHSVTITLPNADGQFEQFEVFEASNFEPVLQARFPEIRAFSGKGITDKYATLKLSISPQGLQTMVFRIGKKNEFIEAYSADHTVYAVYSSQRKSGQLPWNCSTIDERMASEIHTQIANAGNTARSGGDLKTMRLAQSVTAEYSNYFGATSASQVSLVLAGINATLTRCNGVYEKDLALHLNLIASSTNVIYYNAATDPYDAAAAGSGGTWNGQLQSTLTSVIGEANYDIGHLFGASGGGGNAGCIGCVCTNGSKGSGFTSPADGVPQGDNFDIDYVVHEVGHQLGANHTFSMSNEGSGVNKEPGSGITIMGYAGITSQDVAPHSIAFYHQASIAQIQSNLATKTCPVTTNIAANNATPVVAAVGNFTIPKSTPFALTGAATDANGDALTYSWEQNDNASSSQTGASSVASATKASGPNWISFNPTISATRYFPKLATILAGALISGPLPGGDAAANTEALSSVARTLNFRLTVRDNAPFSSTAPVTVGQSAFTDMVVTVSSASGPFAVSSPNTAVSYIGGSTQTITWAVASTTATPVSCASVKISLSTDGGQTFPTVLAASTANDGTEALLIPNTATTTARIKVEAVGNIFFDISNSNFTITAGSACGNATGLSSSAITTNGATVSWAAVTNAVSYAVDYKLNSSSTWTGFSTAQTATSAVLTSLSSGSLYDWRVTTTCATATGTAVAAQFTTLVPCTAPTGLASSVITSSTATVSWTAVSAATSYAVDYKLNSSATWTSFSTAQTGTVANLSGLTASSLYDWRVSATCPSGTTTASAAQFTTTAPAACDAPTGLITAAVTSSSGTVSWAVVSGAVSYAVDFKLNSSSTWINFSTAQAGTSANLSGLSASSLYDWRVTTNCSSGTSAAAAAQFTTTAASTCATAFEPNETLAAALAITSGVTNSAAISSATDIDFYKITTTGSSNIVYNLVGPSGVDYDLYIYNSAGTEIGSGAGSTATETVSLNTQAAGTYYIKVIGYNGATSATCYTIKATATAVTTGCQSTYDVSANGTTSGAATIPYNTNITGLISPSADVDHYKFVITTAGTITATLTTLPADFDLKILNSAGTQVAISQNGSTTSESISYTAAAGTYYAQVFGYNGANSSTTCYTLKVQLGTATKKAMAPAFSVADKNPVLVYPNPVSNFLNIGLSGEMILNSSFVMVDAKGVVVMQQKLVKNPQHVDVSKLSNGVYLVKVNHGGKISTEKFIKQ